MPTHAVTVSTIDEVKNKIFERTALDARRHHTNQNLANEVVREARDGLRKSEKLRALRIVELAAAANAKAG